MCMQSSQCDLQVLETRQLQLQENVSSALFLDFLFLMNEEQKERPEVISLAVLALFECVRVAYKRM